MPASTAPSWRYDLTRHDGDQDDATEGHEDDAAHEPAPFDYESFRLPSGQIDRQAMLRAFDARYGITPAAPAEDPAGIDYRTASADQLAAKYRAMGHAPRNR